MQKERVCWILVVCPCFSTTCSSPNFSTLRERVCIKIRVWPSLLKVLPYQPSKLGVCITWTGAKGRTGAWGRKGSGQVSPSRCMRGIKAAALLEEGTQRDLTLLLVSLLLWNFLSHPLSLSEHHPFIDNSSHVFNENHFLQHQRWRLERRLWRRNEEELL